MNREFSQFTDGLTNQSPTDILVGLDLSLPASQQNTKWTLNSLFATITRNITDKVLRFQAGSNLVVSLNNESALYSDGADLLLSTNGSAWTAIRSGTVTVPQGGTGLTTLTAYAVLAGGTTSTGNLQQVSGLGTSGQVLTSNGAGALPTFQAATAGNPAGIGTELQYRNGAAFGAVSGSSYSAGNVTMTGTLQALIRDAGGQVFNVKAFGAVGNGVTDDYAAIQATIDAAATGSYNHGRVFLPPGDYAITQTLVFQKKTALSFGGNPSATGASTGPVVIKWDGANGGTVILVNQVRDSIFDNFSILPNGGTIGVGIDIDQVAPITATSTNNTFSNISIGTSVTAFRIAANSVANNDLHKFYDCTIFGTGTNGYLINDNQSKYNYICGGTIAGRTNGINQAGGSFGAHRVNFSSNGNDILLGNPTDTIYVENCQSENANRFLDAPVAFGASWAITIVGSRLDTNNMNADGFFIRSSKRGPLNLIGNDFASGTERLNFRVRITGSDVLNPDQFTSRGNVYPNSTPFSLSACNHSSVGDMYVQPSGDGAPLLTELDARAPVIIRGATSGGGGRILDLRPSAMGSGDALLGATIPVIAGDLIVVDAQGAASGTIYSTVRNSGAGASAALLEAATGAGDTYSRYTVGGVAYSVGIDNSDADTFKLSVNGTLGTNDKLTIDSAGKILTAFNSKAGDPTTSDIAAGFQAVYKNTSSGLLSLWANDGGVMKSVALT